MDKEYWQKREETLKVTDEKKSVIENLTELEKKVLESINSNLYAEYGFSDVTIDDVIKSTKLSRQAAGGVISNLVQKGIILVEECEHNFKTDYFYHISDTYLFIHPSFFEEAMSQIPSEHEKI